MKKSDELFNSMKEIVKKYPDTMKEINGDIKAYCSFFPGGSGFFDVTDNDSEKPYMFLGQDWHIYENYKKAIAANRSEIDNSDPTFRNLFQLLEKVGIERKDCFFTNAIMGARKDVKSTGKSPAFKDEEFVESCRDFFKKQIEIIRPRVVFVFGAEPAKFLAPLHDKLKVWGVFKNFNSNDENGNQVIKEVLINGVTADYVILTHPCLRPSNVRHRKYGDASGNDAEEKMIKDVMIKS